MVADKWLTGKGISREALQPFVVPALVALVGLSAFALGRLSAEAQSAATAPAAAPAQP